MRYALFASLTLLACGPRLPSFSDVENAPQPIQVAAKAVVRIQTAGQSGTGMFISGTGLLLTNNHILGTKVCPIEGCFFRVTFQHQLGVKPAPSEVVFGVPMAADVGRDVALVQVFSDDATRVKLGTPDFLTPVETATAASLVGTTVHVIGHPEGRLKKWTQGTVVDATGDWVVTTAFTLPGSSGSAVLNDKGELVGIIHRGSTGEDLISSTSYDATSIGTAAEAIVGVTTLPEVMLSTRASIATREDLIDNNRVYLNGKATIATVGAQPGSILDTLGSACDEVLTRTDFQSPEDLTTALLPCSDALLWIECRTDATPVGYGVSCPGSEQQAWTTRYQKMNTLFHQLYGGVMLAPLSFGAAAFADTQATGIELGAAQLQTALNDTNPSLDFTLALELSAFGVQMYQGHTTVDEVKNYGSTTGYALYGTQIATAALWLKALSLVTDDELKSVLNALLSDPATSLGTRLYIEDAEYQRGFIN